MKKIAWFEGTISNIFNKWQLYTLARVVNANADALKELTGMVKELEAKIQKEEEESR